MEQMRSLERDGGDDGTAYARGNLGPRARIRALGTANPPRAYTQADLLELLEVRDKRIRSLFLSSHIRSRHLILPERDAAPETPAQLVEKHRTWGIRLATEAIERCLGQAGLGLADIGALTCVTSTGFLCPGFSAHLVRALGLSQSIIRLDVLGMGCNAGMNALQSVAGLTERLPGTKALLVCIEICSAAYVTDQSLSTALVNSLFGDGVVAALIEAPPHTTSRSLARADVSAQASGAEASGGVPVLLGFESHIIPEAIHTMRFDLQEGRLAFFLDRDIPYAIGANVAIPVDRLLSRFGLRRRHIQHWVVHSGGRKVIDSIKYNLDLTDFDVRHTLAILRDFGNLSSGAFLFSLQHLFRERSARVGDHGVLMAMGPGASIETALVQWQSKDI